MKLAFCIFKVFPHDGLSREFMNIAAACAHRGHSVRAYAGQWDAPAPDSIQTVAVPAEGKSNPAGDRQFVQWVQEDLQRHPVDLVVGFDKMPGLDVYFAGEPCFEEETRTRRPWAYRLLPDYDHFADFERAVFGDERQVNILTSAPTQNAAYQRHYGTVETRFFTLRPDLEEITRPKDFDAGGAFSRGVRTACDLIEGFGNGVTRPVVAFCLHDFRGTDPVSQNCAEIANACRAAGYHPRIYTMTQRNPPEGFEVIVAPVAAMKEYKRIERFERWVGGHLTRNPVHCVVGLNKMPGLDLYIATEPCAQREVDRSSTRIGISEPIRLRDVFPVGSAARTRQMLASERSVFDGTTRILVTNSGQRDDYADYYDIERSTVEPSGNGDAASVATLIGQEVDTRIQAARDPATATPPGQLSSSANGRGFELYLRDDLTTAWADRDPFEVVRALQGETYRIVKNRRTLRFVENGASYFAKVHDAVGWGEILKELFNLKLPPVGARNEFAACRHLAARRIKAPRVAAFGRQGLNPARARSFVVCDALDGYVSLEDLTDAWLTDPPALALRRHLVYAVADLARRLHGAGVNHRDFYLCHIWAHAAALSRGELELAIIDLHRAQIRPRVPRRWILRDLAALMFSAAHLGLSRNDYLRFLKRYTRRPLRSVLRKDAALLRRVRRRANRLLAESHTREVIGPHRNPTRTVREQA